jgi:four helix bundle protein
MQGFRNLEVWHKSHAVVLGVYGATGAFPKEEMYGLTSQIRRACVSIPANLAEGCARGSDADFARFVQAAMGSANELEYELLLARDLGLLAGPVHQKLEPKILEVKRMLAALLKRLRSDARRPKE